MDDQDRQMHFKFPKSVWTDKDGKEVQFQKHMEYVASRSLSLYWYVDPDSLLPVKAQLVWLWLRRYVLRNLP